MAGVCEEPAETRWLLTSEGLVSLSPELSAVLVGVGERPAILHGGQEREVAQIAEITHVERFDLTPWPGAWAMSRRNKALSARLWCLRNAFTGRPYVAPVSGPRGR